MREVFKRLLPFIWRPPQQWKRGDTALAFDPDPWRVWDAFLRIFWHLFVHGAVLGFNLELDCEVRFPWE
jgi:hypothetical protein